MLIFYKGSDSKYDFFKLILHPGNESDKDLVNIAVSHSEWNSSKRTQQRYNDAKTRLFKRNRCIAFDINDGFHSRSFPKSTAFQTLMELPVGKELLSLFESEGKTYAITSAVEMKRHLKSRRPAIDCLMAKVMAELEDFLIRTASFDMSLAGNADQLDDETKNESTELIRRYAQAFASRIQDIVDAHRREKGFSATEEQKAANSVLLMDLELLETQNLGLLMPS